ncbi:MAG: SDR family oxidoreductase [Elusimicrobia bacterium]|nr:SDR family oxidoreductase [Elusimicrobiota bacterium]
MTKTLPALLLTGATGYIGRRLAAGLEGSWTVFRASRTAAGERALDLNLAEPESIRRAFDAAAPAVVVHAGAEADPDACERDPERARRVNVDAVKTLGRLCGASRTRLIHFSTDLVFDGERGWYSEEDAPNPRGVYARGKLESEEAALAGAPGAVVLRVSTAYGRSLGGRPSFVDGLRGKLAAGEAVTAFTDQWRTSTAADQLPEVLARLLADPDLEGVFHWGGAERATRFATAEIFARVMGFDERLVRPGRAADVRFASPRPRDSSLDSSRLAAAIGVAPLGYEAGFKALLEPAPDRLGQR